MIIDKVFNGFTIKYYDIFNEDKIDKYIKKELHLVLKKHNLYNLIPSIYDMYFKFYKDKSINNLLYAENIYEKIYYKKLRDYDEKIYSENFHLKQDNKYFINVLNKNKKYI